MESETMALMDLPCSWQLLVQQKPKQLKKLFLVRMKNWNDCEI